VAEGRSMRKLEMQHIGPRMAVGLTCFKSGAVHWPLPPDGQPRCMLTIDEVRAIPLFSTLSDADLERLVRTAADLRLRAGEFAVHEGGERALFAVLSGKVQVVKQFDGIERTLGWRLPGAIFGEVPLAFATPFPGGYRAAEPSRVMRVGAAPLFRDRVFIVRGRGEARRTRPRAHRRPSGHRASAPQGPDRSVRRSLGPGVRRLAPLSFPKPDHP
jgi:hypothetical protein